MNSKEVGLLTSEEVEKVFNRLLFDATLTAAEIEERVKEYESDEGKCKCLKCRIRRGEFSESEMPKAHREGFMRTVLRVLFTKEMREGMAAYSISAVSVPKDIPDLSDGTAILHEAKVGGNFDDGMAAVAVLIEEMLDRMCAQEIASDRHDALTILLGKLAQIHAIRERTKRTLGVRSFMDAMIGDLMKHRKAND